MVGRPFAAGHHGSAMRVIEHHSGERDRQGTCGYKRRKVQSVKALKERPQAGLGLLHFEMEGNNYAHATCHPDSSSLSGLPRCRARRGWSARLDIDCLGGLYGLSRLLDREMQHALIEMSVDGSVL